MGLMRSCTVCAKKKQVDDFPIREGNSRRTICNSCFNELRRRRRAEKHEVSPSPAPLPDIADTRIDKLFQLTRKTSLAFSDLCDKLDVSPKRLKLLIEKAINLGLPIQIRQDQVGVRLPEPREDVQDAHIAPTVGERQRVAVISDTHYGSKYCLRGAIKDFIKYAYEKGCREVLHPGDILDGNYRHGRFEMTHMGLTRQIHDLQKNLPRYPGLTYHAITGNHDFTFTEESGVNVGKSIEDAFVADGRNDFRSYGDRGAFISLRGVLFYLWHPGGGLAYANSYKLQKRIEAFTPAEKPAVLLTGHYHRFCYIQERSVHGILCPTFQGGGSAFGKMLGSTPAIGGLILEWDATETGTIRNFNLERRTYFEREPISLVKV